jgi:MinD superfamily P-loop ATPase
VVEPTLSGIHDLKRALELLRHFDVEPLVCVNKYDLNTDNTDEITGFCAENDVAMVGCVPFDPEVTKAMVQGRPVVEHRPRSPASAAMVEVWAETRTHLGV